MIASRLPIGAISAKSEERGNAERRRLQCKLLLYRSRLFSATSLVDKTSLSMRVLSPTL